MRVVFGWNNFKIKSFEPYQLGLTKEQTDFTVEVRQSYFHLFWIPFFGLGKKWVVRKNKELYVLPAAYESIIKQQKLDIKTPWYTFAGPILILVGFIGYLGMEKYNGHKSYVWAKKHHEEKVAALEAGIQHLSTNDFVKISEVNNEYGSGGMYLKVEEIKGNNVLCTKVFTGKDDYYSPPMVVEKFYLENKPSLEKIEINKNDFNNAYTKDYDLYNSNKKSSVDLLKDNRLFEIEKIDRHFGPIISERGTGSYGGGSIGMDFINYGWPAKIIEIKNLEGNLQWKTELPLEVKTSFSDYTNFFLQADQFKNDEPYKFILVLEDSLLKRHEFEIEGVNMDKTVKKLN